jgi:hypothetical protein
LLLIAQSQNQFRFCVLKVPGFAEDDIVLAVVMFIGTLALDAESAPLLANNRLIRQLFDVLTGKYS